MQQIKLMPDYGCYPLWHCDNVQFGDIDPKSLPISELLMERLLDWSSQFDSTLNQIYPPDSGFSCQEREKKFVDQGYELALQLKAELKNVSVLYFDITKNLERSI